MSMHKRLLVLLKILFFLCFSSFLPAAEVYVGPLVESFNLTVNNSSSSIAGDLGAERDVRLSGALWGIEGRYRSLTPFLCSYGGIYYNVEASWKMGRITGKGDLHRFIHDFEEESVLGYEFVFCRDDEIKIIPYAGFGYTYLVESNVGEMSPLKYKYQTFYVPIGVSFHYAYNDWFCVCFDFKMKPQIDSYVKISALHGARWDLHNKYGYYAEVPIRFTQLYNCINLTLIPYWEWTKNGATTSKIGDTPLGIPSQKYTEWGAKFFVSMFF